ncbi:MAG: ParB/RepB/Spo0J family partition protein [Armatimonadota bacterium]
MEVPFVQSAIPQVVMIPVDRIRVVNHRNRDKKKFNQIVENISSVGLKKPITVRLCEDGYYELACGEGRLQAFKQLSQTEVPAVVRNIPKDELLLMSIVENLARNRSTPLEAVARLVELRDRGYTHEDIARKVGLSHKYVSDLLCLHEHGEERLIQAVRTGRINMTSATIIMRCSVPGGQDALIQIQQEQQLPPNELKRIRNMVNERKFFGPRNQRKSRNGQAMTSESIVRAVRREQERQRETLKKAELCEKRLLFAMNALKVLYRDEYFTTLLRAEGLSDLPQFLADQVKGL